jgi:hypothetical protein
MSSELSNSDELNAIQINDHLILTARRRVGQPGQILYFQQRSSSAGMPEFALLRENVEDLPIAPGAPPSGTFAFMETRVATPVPMVRVFGKDGHRDMPVQQFSEGIPAAGMKLSLPVINSTASVDDAIRAMRNRDTRAVVVSYSPTNYQLLMNHQIARAHLQHLTLADIRPQGHTVSSWSDAIPEPRTRLFSMVQPLNQPTADIASLYESVGGVVANASKICLCSSNIRSHTVWDQAPSLDGTPCRKPTQGHGTLKCF